KGGDADVAQSGSHDDVVRAEFVLSHRRIEGIRLLCALPQIPGEAGSSISSPVCTASVSASHVPSRRPAISQRLMRSWIVLNDRTESDNMCACTARYLCQTSLFSAERSSTWNLSWRHVCASPTPR